MKWDKEELEGRNISIPRINVERKIIMKKIISLVLMILMCLSIVPMTDASIKASATSKTQDEAIAWVQSQVGKSIDTDGYPSGQPYQCVDLIKAYYSYLGVSPVSGNGADYATNFLPSGWQRLQGAQPQKGDILVYTGGYGHVAIYESDRVHYHQNFDNKYYVTKVTYKYNGLSNSYWGVIRPNWSSTPVEPTYFTALWHGDIGETNARIDASINLTYIQQCGFYYGTGTSNMARVIEDTYANTLNIWFDFNEYGITLSPGTTYYYKIFIVVNGNEYQTATQYFTTTGHSHSYNSSVTTQPTCTKEGVRTYKCSCGASYTETIAKTAHNSNTKIPAVAATCTKTGLTEGKKCSVCGTVTVTQQTVTKKAHAEVTDKAVDATCTAAGLTQGKHCSVCNTIIVAQQTVAALGHADNNFDGKCDRCGVSSSTPDEPDAPTDDCSCNCHKGGIVGFFFKIINFFQKLFGKNKVCVCGVAH